jgi:uncharacterized protein (TIGR02598 family)
MRPFSLSGFSLVEVTIATAVVSFAFVTVFALIPAGLNTFRSSINATVMSEIAQRGINDCQQTDFTKLITDTNGIQQSGTNSFMKPIRYFDDQGNELTSSNSAIYWVNTRVTPATTLPYTSQGSGILNSRLASVMVQIAHNPTGINLSASDNLWVENAPGSLSMLNFQTYVSKSTN